MLRLVGQTHFLSELGIIVDQIKEGKNFNLLISAPSGYGKTHLALIIVSLCGGNTNNAMLYIPNDQGKIKINPSKRFHILDEAHTLKEQEIVYPLMDSNKYVFIVCTNETGGLKEPLINRCIPFIFSNYNDEELKEILALYLTVKLPNNFLDILVQGVKRNPRIAKLTAIRISAILSKLGVPENEKEFRKILEEYLTIDSDGLDILDRKYLEYLRKVGGRSSLQNISFGTRIDSPTILRDIEPNLLLRSIIKITSKGRELNDNNLDK